MGERRSLIEGLVPTPPAHSLERERSFVYAGRPAPQAPAAQPANAPQSPPRPPSQRGYARTTPRH
jgi:hypothetical protein